MYGLKTPMGRTQRSQKNMTAKPSSYPQGHFKDKNCGWCKQPFSPSGPSHRYCCEHCFKKVYADKYYKRRYGVGLDWIEETLLQQNHVCAICEQVGFKMLESHYTGLNLDHCHRTSKPRGLLCHNCNRGIGLLQDDPNIMERAAAYVKKHANL